jgi:hypothetical protein
MIGVVTNFYHYLERIVIAITTQKVTKIIKVVKVVIHPLPPPPPRDHPTVPK